MRMFILLLAASALCGCGGIKVYRDGETIPVTKPAFDVSSMPFEPVDYSWNPSSYPSMGTDSVYGGRTTYGGQRVTFGSVTLVPGQIHFDKK